MLTNEQILASVETAFLPLHVNAEIRDYDATLRIEISENPRYVIRTDQVALLYAQDEELLGSIIRRVREKIRGKGYLLH